MHLDPNPLLLLGVIVAAGVASGAAARRLRLPGVTGQILAGVLLGPSILGWIPSAGVAGLEPVTHFALGLMAVAIGSHLHLRRLRNATRRLLFLLILEAILTPLFVYQALILVPGTPWYLALLLATLAVSTAPATVLAIVKETRSKGVFVKTLLAGVALDNIACICLFEMAYAGARAGLDPLGGHSIAGVLGAPFLQFGASAALGGGTGAVLILATRRVVRSDRLATASILAILLVAGLANALGISMLLACLFLGVTLANLTPEREEIGHAVFVNFESAILAAFFTLAGLELDFAYVVPGGLLALVAAAARGASKFVSARLAMRLAGATDRVRRHLGTALVPQAGVAVGLLLYATDDPAFAGIRDLLLAVGLTTVTINELIGPILTRLALARSGDFGRDRARLIDFLHEENIVTDLDADSKEEAITRLTDLLIESHHLRVDRDRFLDGILERERAESTSVGGGLAIPHGDLEGEGSMVGVMGISREGLRFDTPDGRPVHCMVLLATPLAERDRHLQVLAALARSIASDRGIQHQLFHAKSPAHAYELLHAGEESEELNYFLEDAGAG